MQKNKTSTSGVRSIKDSVTDPNQNEAGSFDILDLSRIEENKSIFPFDYTRKIFYSATLLNGDYSLEFEDKTIDVKGDTLILTSTKIPFGIHHKGEVSGISCLFKEDFITKNNCGYRLLEFPIYKPGQQNIYSLTDKQAKHFIEIYTKIFDEKLANNKFKESLQRNYLLELIFNAQKLNPVSFYINKNNTTQEITCSFIRLLESQFPINTPQDVVSLKTSGDFASHLALHPNYLNRQVKLSKGRTVSEIINARVEQEAKILLKLTNWNIAEIAYSLGFEEPSHFNSFFKKHTRVSPTDYRKLQGE